MASFFAHLDIMSVEMWAVWINKTIFVSFLYPEFKAVWLLYEYKKNCPTYWQLCVCNKITLLAFLIMQILYLVCTFIWHTEETL